MPNLVATNTQTATARRLWLTILEYESPRPPRGAEPPKEKGRLVATRRESLFAILGSRGAGKTTVLSNLRKIALSNPANVVLETIEPELFWPGDSVLSMVLSAIKDRIAELETEWTAMSSARRSGLARKRVRPVDVHATWDSLRRASGTIEAKNKTEQDPAANINSYSAGYSIPHLWSCLVFQLLDLSAAIRGGEAAPLLVVPVDDVDLRPSENLKILDETWALSRAPGAVFVLTADQDLLLRALERRANQLADSQGEKPDGVDANFAQRLSKDQYRKLLPENRLVRLSNWRGADLLEYRSQVDAPTLSDVLSRIPSSRRKWSMSPPSLLGYFDLAWKITGNSAPSAMALAEHSRMLGSTPREISLHYHLFQRCVGNARAKSRRIRATVLSIASWLINSGALAEAGIEDCLEIFAGRVEFNADNLKAGSQYSSSTTGQITVRYNFRQYVSTKDFQVVAPPQTSAAILLLYDLLRECGSDSGGEIYGSMSLPDRTSGMFLGIEGVFLANPFFGSFWKYGAFGRAIELFRSEFLRAAKANSQEQLLELGVYVYELASFAIWFGWPIPMYSASIGGNRGLKAEWARLTQKAVLAVRALKRSAERKVFLAGATFDQVVDHSNHLAESVVALERAGVSTEGVACLREELYAALRGARPPGPNEIALDEQLDNARRLLDIRIRLKRDKEKREEAERVLATVEPAELAQLAKHASQVPILQGLLRDSFSDTPSDKWRLLRQILAQEESVPVDILEREAELNTLLATGRRQPSQENLSPTAERSEPLGGDEALEVTFDEDR